MSAFREFGEKDYILLAVHDFYDGPFCDSRQ